MPRQNQNKPSRQQTCGYLSFVVLRKNGWGSPLKMTVTPNWLKQQLLLKQMRNNHVNQHTKQANKQASMQQQQERNSNNRTMTATTTADQPNKPTRQTTIESRCRDTNNALLTLRPVWITFLCYNFSVVAVFSLFTAKLLPTASCRY